MVERESLSDPPARLVDGSLTYALAELATVDRAALVLEDRYGAVFKTPYVAPGFLADLPGALQVPYPQVPIVFCDTRPQAEEWTFRFLGDALAPVQQDDDPVGNVTGASSSPLRADQAIGSPYLKAPSQASGAKVGRAGSRAHGASAAVH